MIHRKIGRIVLLLCICMAMMPMGVFAASTADAVEPIQTDRECSLTVSYCYGEIAFSDLEVRLYKIATVTSDFQYTLTQSFASTGLILNGIQSAGEWKVVRSTLEAYILANGIELDARAVTNADGQVCWEALQTGLYLALVGPATQEELHCRFDSALVALPGLSQEGKWQYSVSVNAKAEVLPPVEPDEEIEYKVLKLWKGDEGRADRPKRVEVEIFRNGVSYEVVFLSEETNWAYSWTALDDGASWKVIERNVPQEYTMTVEERETSFVLTNTRIPTEPDDPIQPPQTGDTANGLLFILLLTAAGSLLIIFGVTGKRKNV